MAIAKPDERADGWCFLVVDEDPFGMAMEAGVKLDERENSEKTCAVADSESGFNKRHNAVTGLDDFDTSDARAWITLKPTFSRRVFYPLCERSAT